MTKDTTALYTCMGCHKPAHQVTFAAKLGWLCGKCLEDTEDE